MTRLAIEGARKIPGSKIAAYCPSENRYYVLRHVFSHRDSPQLVATLMKIREAGTIDPRLWRPARKNEY